MTAACCRREDRPVARRRASLLIDRMATWNVGKSNQSLHLTLYLLIDALHRWMLAWWICSNQQMFGLYLAVGLQRMLVAADDEMGRKSKEPSCAALAQLNLE